MISLEVLRHIRGDGHGVQPGALPKTIQERKLKVSWQRQSVESVWIRKNPTSSDRLHRCKRLMQELNEETDRKIKAKARSR